MGRIVYCPINSITVAASGDTDIWELAAPANRELLVHGWEIGSSSASAEALEMRLLRGTASGSGGGTGTEVLRNVDDAAVAGVVEVNNTTPGTDGDILQTFSWEQLGPLGQVYTPEMRIHMLEGTWLKLNMVTAPTEFECNGWICWEVL